MTTSLFDEAADTTADPTSAPETPHTRRVFRFENHTIPDPGAQLSVEDVRKALVLYFPDLVQATTTTQTEGDTLVVTFAKQTTRKGAAGATPPSEVAPLAERLLALTPLPDALAELHLPQDLTFAEVVARRDAIQAALTTRAINIHHCERIYRRCLHLRPIPLCSRLPLGF
jgi:PRTRC genetic system protein C